MSYFISSFEEELRRIDDSISLPYWDYTVDYQIDNPANSLVWSEIFFGNGNGRLSTGDFRGWMSPKGPVQRRYGESNYAQLMSRSDVAKIISKCNTAVGSLVYINLCLIKKKVPVYRV